jgi:hypothetical protein
MIRMLLLVAALAAAGCAQPHVGQVMPDKPLEAGQHGRLDQISVADMQARATMVRAQVRNGAVVEDKTFLDRGVSTEAQVAIGVTSGIGAAVVNGVAGYAIMDRKARAIENQQPSQTNLSLTAVGSTAPNIANAAANTAVQAGADVAIAAGCGLPICP